MIIRKKIVTVAVCTSVLVLPFGASASGKKDTTAAESSSSAGKPGSSEMPPPDGMGPQNGQMMPPPGGDNQQTITLEGELTIDGSKSSASAPVELKDKKIASTKSNRSAVLVVHGAQLILSGAVLTKTGDSSSTDQSNFTGLNAGALASSGSRLTLINTSVDTDAEGANAVFASGKGSSVTASNIKIHTQKNSSRGLDATYSGTITAENVDITTEGAHCAALATDRGEGTVTVHGGRASTAGEGSPVIYSTGNITASGLTGNASGSEIAVIEGKNSITLDTCDLTGSGMRGIMLYQSFSGDAENGTSSFTARDSVLTSTSAGPFFYITNTNAKAALSGTKLVFKSGILIHAAGNDGAQGWGQQGSNGGIFLFTAHDQDLKGDIVCDAISSIDFVLSANAAYTGAVNTAKEGAVSVTLENSAVWNVTADSWIAGLKDTDVTFSNIHSNGHTVYYDKTNSRNLFLGSKTVTLPDGGKLVPYTAEHKKIVKASSSSTGSNGGPGMGGPGMGGPGAPGGMQPPSGGPGKPGDMKTVTGLVFVRKSGTSAGTYLTASDSIEYKLVVGNAFAPPSESGGMPGKNGDTPGAKADYTFGSGKKPAAPRMVTSVELQNLAGKKVSVEGIVRTAQNGTKELTVFNYTEQ